MTYAVIPYTTFPTISIGPLQLRTFGLMVGLGVLVGTWVGARYVEAHTDMTRDDVYRMATRMVIAGVIGARITWDITHWSEIESPIDLIAVWNGGLQFAGGFIAAVLVAIPTVRKWPRLARWYNLDGYAYGLTIGLAIGRIGCISVGEHFGSHSSWLLAVRYDGGVVREGHLGPNPLELGSEFHNTAVYELLWMLLLFGILTLLISRRPPPGTVMGVFCLYYGVMRGLSDFLRVNDKTFVGLTGAQWMCLALIPTGIWVLTRVRSANAAELLEAPHDEFALDPGDHGGTGVDAHKDLTAEEDQSSAQS